MAKKKEGKTKKKDRKVLSDKEKKEKAAKYLVANENYKTINSTEFTGKGKEKVTVTTQVIHVRGKGLIIREVTSTGSVSSVYVPGVKVKKKKEWLTIVEDKGPKKKKEKKEKK